MQRMRVAQYAVVLVPSANLVLQVERSCYNSSCCVINYSSAFVIVISNNNRTLNFPGAPRNPLKYAAIHMWPKAVIVAKWCPTMLALIHQLNQPRPVLGNFSKTRHSPTGYTRWVYKKLPGDTTWVKLRVLNLPETHAWNDHLVHVHVR